MQPPTPLSGPVAAAPHGRHAVPGDAIEQAAVQFEALFIQQMLKSMRQGAGALAEDDGMFRQDPDDPLLGLADQLLADSLAGQRALGIADLLLRQLQPPAPLKPQAGADALSLQMPIPSPSPQEPTP